MSYKGTKSKRRPKPSMSEGAGLLSQDSRQREGSRALMGPCAALTCAASLWGKDYSKDTLRITSSAGAKSNFLGGKKRAT